MSDEDIYCITITPTTSLKIQTGPGARPASCTMDTGSFPEVKCDRGVLLTTHPLLVPRPWKSRTISLPTLWATAVPVKGSLCLLLLPYLGFRVLYITRSPPYRFTSLSAQGPTCAVIHRHSTPPRKKTTLFSCH